MQSRSIQALTAFALLTAGHGITQAADTPAPAASAVALAEAPIAAAAPLDNFCFIKGAPPSDFRYTRVKDMKLGKGTYGQVKEILDEFASDAQAAGADAIINYSGSQRFGFWPWRMVRPVVRGTAIKWTSEPKPDCKKAGGAPLSEVLATNEVGATGAGAPGSSPRQ